MRQSLQFESTYVRAAVPFEKTYTLGRSIAAIQILSGLNEAPRLGLMTRLPEGAEIDLRGPGFDEQTVRVRCAGVPYYVFVADLEPVRKPAAFAAAAG